MRKGGKIGGGVKTGTGVRKTIGASNRIRSGWGTVTAGRSRSAGAPETTVDKRLKEGRLSPNHDNVVSTPIPD
jgi:hypothetical protein